MTGSVYLCSPTNSTLFTTCCRTAICDDEANCPHCGEAVLPRSGRDRWEAAYGPTRRRMRAADKRLRDFEGAPHG